MCDIHHESRNDPINLVNELYVYKNDSLGKNIIKEYQRDDSERYKLVMYS